MNVLKSRVLKDYNQIAEENRHKLQAQSLLIRDRFRL